MRITKLKESTGNFDMCNEQIQGGKTPPLKISEWVNTNLTRAAPRNSYWGGGVDLTCRVNLTIHELI